MKRTATAAVAAATALSIVAAPAFAEETAGTGETKEASSIADIVKSSDKDREDSSQDGEKSSSIKGSSDIDDDAARNYYNKDEASPLLNRIVGDKTDDDLNDALKPFTSSLKADAAQEWNPGTTLNILIGVGVVAALLGIANAGVIPGLSLPNIPLPF